jgi:hypothetical protein
MPRFGKRGLRRIAAFLPVLLLTACSSYPLGMDKATYEALTPQQRLTARQEQARLDAEAEKARAEERAASESARRVERQRLQALYDQEAGRIASGEVSARVSQISIEGGEIKVPVGGGLSFDRDWRPAAPVTFALAECETRGLKLKRADKSGSRNLMVTRRRNMVFVGEKFAEGCAPVEADDSARAYPPRGRYALDIPETVRNARIRIAPWGDETDPTTVIIQIR